MIATLPAVQSECSRVFRYVCRGSKGHAHDKRIVNRRHRRYLNTVTRSFAHNPELFYDECFTAPSLSTWDLW